MNPKSIALVILGLVAIVAVVGLVMLFRSENAVTGDVARLYEGQYGRLSYNSVQGSGCIGQCAQYKNDLPMKYNMCYMDCMRPSRVYSLGSQQVGTVDETYQ
jgi:hypothetical protein